MNIDTFCEFEQIEEYEYSYKYSGWIGNPAEETCFYEKQQEEEDSYV